MENMNILIGMTKYVKMSVCISAGSLCFCFIVVAMAGFALNRFFNFIWVFTSRFPPQTSIKRKKKAVRKKKNSPINPNNDASLNDNSQLKDTKIGSVESIRLFTYKTLVDATQNFALDRRLSGDCLGSVYKGKIIDTNEVVSIRQLSYNFVLNVEEFVGKVLLLSQANHQNLAKLIGYSVHQYCDRFVVYKYESGGSLQNHLHGNQTCLDWKLRMKIAHGVAKAVEYLQNDMKPPILHYYIQPSNIWLDEEMTPKLSAFGLVGMYFPRSGSDYCIETCGSYFYGEHDIRLIEEVTIETDVRGFGILLLEMITGMKGRFRGKDGLNRNLTDWVRPYLEGEKNLASMVDAKLDGKFNIEELYDVCNLAEACIEKQPSHRPRISDVVKRMEGLAK
ncbi:putative serine/threonine-protein kinase PBL6 [Silene latifolia]|uniref:putative serine/threonine-protein kinase PBL6 n=1 Tax=Silene latifolia TaxID=37657 RepID=UPI003D77BF06